MKAQADQNKKGVRKMNLIKNGIHITGIDRMGWGYICSLLDSEYIKTDRIMNDSKNSDERAWAQNMCHQLYGTLKQIKRSLAL